MFFLLLNVIYCLCYRFFLCCVFVFIYFAFDIIIVVCSNSWKNVPDNAIRLRHSEQHWLVREEQKKINGIITMKMYNNKNILNVNCNKIKSKWISCVMMYERCVSDSVSNLRSKSIAYQSITEFIYFFVVVAVLFFK